MEAIHKENVMFLESSGGTVNARQAECLMRVWSKLGRDLRSEKKEALEAEVYRRADHWLSRASWRSPGVAIRKILRCRAFELVRASLP
jgi:hypothetical protein